MDRHENSGHPPIDGSVGHEVSDAHFRPIIIFLVSLGVLVVMVFSLMVWMFDYLERQAAATDRQPSALVDRKALPPEPRLQVVPRLELQQYKEAVTRQIESYEWIDKEAGVVRIPVERAMELIVERGLPVASSEKGTAGAAKGGE